LFKQFEENANRVDNSNYAELSINWYDDESALDQIISTKTDKGEICYKAGVGVFCRTELDKLCKRNPYSRDCLCYERNEITTPGRENIYHGNLLMLKEVAVNKKNKLKRDMIASSLAMNCYVEIVHKPSNILEMLPKS